MNRPTVCMIHEGIGDYNAIAKIAKVGVEIALEAGWNVTCIAKRLDERLLDRVTWLKLHVPSRMFLYKWLTARKFISRALDGRSFDVVHAHQPQVADLSDIFQCHFLTRMSFERDCRDHRPGLRGVLMRGQERGVLMAEDYFYRRWNPQTRMLYDSELTRTDFHRLYGACANEDVLVYPSPAPKVVSAEERRAARAALLGTDQDRIVVGYLGGLHERKGYRRLVKAITADPRLFLLMGGQYSQDFVSKELAGRYKALGLVTDISSFYAACDVFAVPSHYEPLGLVAFEAAARGVPVLATPEVGALPHLVEHGAGMEWNPELPLGPLAMDMMARRESFERGAAELVKNVSRERYGQRLISEYESVMERRSARVALAPRAESGDREIASAAQSLRGRQTKHRPTLCVIHEGIGNYNAIAKVAMAGVEVALEAGWEVSCVAKRLDEDLARRVQWLPLHVPSRVFLYKWLTARHYIKKALGGRTFDVIHAHQPQVADLSDIFQCHFLTHMLFERQCTDRTSGMRGVFRELQERAVLIAEDFAYRNWNQNTRILYNSEGTRRDFAKLYGEPPMRDVLPCPMPAVNLAGPAERKAAKEHYFGQNCDRPVVGYLGGAIERKGAERLVAAASTESELNFLIGGGGAQSLVIPAAAASRCRQIGLLSQLDQFYAACDVLIIPSFYEPLGLVAFEAAARGTPVIATPEVGALPHLLEHGVGAEWQAGSPLLPVVTSLLSRGASMPAAVAGMEADLGPERYSQRLIAAYETVLRQKAREAPHAGLVAEVVQ